MFNKFLHKFKKKIPGFVFYSGGLFASVIFFALVTLTPLSNIFVSFLKNDLFFMIEKENPDKFSINTNKILLNLSFPRINNARDFENIPVVNNINPPETTEPEKDYIYNPYENIPVADDDSILSTYDLYAYYQSINGVKIEDATFDKDIEIPADYYKITPSNYSSQKTKTPKLLINNQTYFDINNDNFNEYISKPYPINSFDPKKKDEPVVLILNTHSTESYVEDGTSYYSPPFTAERTTDTNKNVVLIASQLRKKLEEYNIPVIQSSKLHDAVSYRDSYTRSLETMNEYLQKYPSIKYIIDVHRDSMIAADGEKFKPTIKINGKDCSQVMIVVGTDEGGGYHPNWRDNLTFAVYLQQKMNDKYPMLARPINLRNARFNQHTTKGTIILEVGSCGSSFSEALCAADLFGECFAEMILEQN